MGRILLVACTLAVLVAAPAHAATAFDYTRVHGLSQPSYATERTTVRVPSFDGTELYLEIVKPTAPGPWPVIMEASPYHGTRDGREGDDLVAGSGLTGWYARRGYAVVLMDMRGTGRSAGCLDQLGPTDAKDLKLVVEWAARQAWSNGRVGMVGLSYDGATSITAAAQRPEGLATIVQEAGFASMYDHQFQAGVPFYLHWASPVAIYESLAVERKLPGGDDDGHRMEETACGAASTSLVSGEDQLSGRYSAWHAARDYRAQATAADIPVFAMHGVNDANIRVSALEWFTQRRRPGDKLWIGQWDHGHVASRGDQLRHAVLAWLDRHLAGRAVKTGPALEAFLTDGTFDPLADDRRTEVLTGTHWPPASQPLTFHPAADGTLSTAPAPAGTHSFDGKPSGFAQDTVEAYAGVVNGMEVGSNARPRVTAPTDGTLFTSEPLQHDLVIAGIPTMRLSVAVTVERVHLIATLYDALPDGGLRRITQFAIQPELRSGLDHLDPMIPAQRYDLAPPGFAMAHHLRAGHRLTLRVSTSDPDKIPTFATDPHVTVFTGPGATEVTVPVIENPVLAADSVPLGP